MMRPAPAHYHETAQDRVNERRAIARAAEVLKCDGYAKLPPIYPIDFALERARRIVYWAEVKCRTCESSTYIDYAVSVAKLGALYTLLTVTDITPILVVGWSDCMGILMLPCPGSYCAVGGRRDRTDAPNDIEPLQHYPVESFRRFPWESAP